jgi:PAS domain S-box-containing protein
MTAVDGILYAILLNSMCPNAGISYQSLTCQAAAQQLRQQKEKIVELWVEGASKESKVARSLERDTLIDSLPELLDNMIESLSYGESVANLQQSADIGRKHGESRAAIKEYPLNEVIIEYRILSKIIFSILQEKVRIDLQTENLLNDAIHRGIGNSAAEFIRFRNEIMEREIAHSEETFRHLVEGVKDYAIFTLDTNGFITTWNLGAVRMDQYTVEEAVGQHYSILYPEEGKLRNDPENHLIIAATNGRFRGEGLRVRKNGELFLSDVLITPIYHQGELVGYSKVVQDLTERNQLIQERDLSRARAEVLRMEQQIRERFVATLSHDLRNPLTAAKINLGMIERNPCNLSKHSEFSERAVRSLNRIDRMLVDLLDINRINVQEQIHIDIAKCDIEKIIMEAVAELSTIHGDRFVVETRPSIIGYWDCTSLRRVIENLADNAVKYGAPLTSVTIQAKQIDSRLLLKVHNFGEVILPTDQAALFDPFHRSKAAQASKVRGWGLGLSLARAITEAHHGIIMVESIPSKGTTFTVDLPIDARVADAPSPSGALEED